MTLLVGSNVTTGFVDTAQRNDTFVWYKAYTASVTGSATSLRLYTPVFSSSRHYRLGIWTSTGTLLQVSSELIDDFDGFQIGTITPQAIVSGTSYLLGIIPAGDGDIPYYSDSTGFALKNHAMSGYPSAPNVDPGTDVGNGDDFLMFADGTTGGGSGGAKIFSQSLSRMMAQ